MLISLYEYSCCCSREFEILCLIVFFLPTPLEALWSFVWSRPASWLFFCLLPSALFAAPTVVDLPIPKVVTFTHDGPGEGAEPCELEHSRQSALWGGRQRSLHSAHARGSRDREGQVHMGVNRKMGSSLVVVSPPPSPPPSPLSFPCPCLYRLPHDTYALARFCFETSHSTHQRGCYEAFCSIRLPVGLNQM